MKDFRKLFSVRPGQPVRLGSHDTDFTGNWTRKTEAKRELKKNARRLAELQYRLYAENRRSVLIVLQAMDTGGKDGTIRHVMTGMNPQSCRVHSFKKPTLLEADHDFLWRIHQRVPAKGEIGIFNRSHYEDVLIVRVHGLVAKSIWSKRYDAINRFEEYLAENGTVILKFFLHISKEEQKKRLESRLTNPKKKWKINPDDLSERKLWNDYVSAYEAVLSHCSTPWAPWYIIPSNHKWFRNLAVSRIIEETLAKMKPKFPKPPPGISKLKIV